MENKLIPLSDFVLKTLHTPNVNEAICWEQTEERLQKIYMFTQFIKQPFELHMFVPVDKNGNIIEFIEYEAWTGSDDHYNEYMNEYLEAYERVLFEGFEEKKKGLKDTVINEELNFAIYIQPSLGYTIESLCNKNLTLTETAIKQIYGS